MQIFRVSTTEGCSDGFQTEDQPQVAVAALLNRQTRTFG